jgi:hypothetical protein
MVKCGVLFEVRTDFLSIIKTTVGFKGLKKVAHIATTVLLSVKKVRKKENINGTKSQRSVSASIYQTA